MFLTLKPSEVQYRREKICLIGQLEAHKPLRWDDKRIWGPVWKRDEVSSLFCTRMPRFSIFAELGTRKTTSWLLFNQEAFLLSSFHITTLQALSNGVPT